MAVEKILIKTNSPVLLESIQHNPLVESLEAEIVLTDFETPVTIHPMANRHLTEETTRDSTKEGQNLQSRTLLSGGPLWASPIEMQEEPATPVAVHQARQATPLVPGEVPHHEASQAGTPSSKAGLPTAATAVDLLLPLPPDAARLTRFCHRLEMSARARIVSIAGSCQEGAILKLALHESVPLMQVLHRMPEVAQAWEESPPKRGISSLFRGRGKALCFTEGEKRIRLLFKDAMEPVQLAFNL